MGTLMVSHVLIKRQRQLGNGYLPHISCRQMLYFETSYMNRET